MKDYVSNIFHNKFISFIIFDKCKINLTFRAYNFLPKKYTIIFQKMTLMNINKLLYKIVVNCSTSPSLMIPSLKIFTINLSKFYAPSSPQNINKTP